MLELVNIKVDGNYIYAYLNIEGEETKYKIVFLIDDPIKVSSSEIPEDLWIYRRQALQAIRHYTPDNLPESITSAWY